MEKIIKVKVTGYEAKLIADAKETMMHSHVDQGTLQMIGEIVLQKLK